MRLPAAPAPPPRRASPAASSPNRDLAAICSGRRLRGAPFLTAEELNQPVPLLVRHGEDAVPSDGRLVEQVLLAAFPVHAGRSVVGRAVKNFLERVLRLFPVPGAIKL